MTEIVTSDRIAGVKFVHLRAFGDERGRFLETFRQNWFPERTWEIVQTNRSDSRAGVLRGLHYHFHQVDYWYCVAGRIRVGLADLRRGSPTYGASQAIEIGGDHQIGVLIPCGVAHGFYALTDATLTYIVDNYYDGADELGVAWDDPTLAVPWQAGPGQTGGWEAGPPILSGRDRQNPRLEAIREEHRP